MNLVPAGVSLSFEVTYDAPSLPVAMSVYDDSGPSPVLVQGPTAMLNWTGNSYRGKFTATAGKQYLVLKAAYTDGTFTTLDPNNAQGTESFVAQNIAGGTTTAIVYEEIVAEIVPPGSQIIEALIGED